MSKPVAVLALPRRPGGRARSPVEVGTTTFGSWPGVPALTVDPDGSVLAWDELMEGWTRCHSIPEDRQEQARTIAGRVWSGGYRPGPFGSLVPAEGAS